MRQKIEHNLIEKAVSGDAAAFNDIYFALRSSIYGFAYRMLRNVGAAEDITQETFIFLLANWHRFDSSRGDLLPFLCGVARNKILRYLQKSSTRNEFGKEDLAEFADLETPAASPLDSLLKAELSEKVEEQIARLPALQREVLILREIEELSYLEIARVTETELGQVKIRLHRARKTLAKELTPYLTGTEEKCYEML